MSGLQLAARTTAAAIAIELISIVEFTEIARRRRRAFAEDSGNLWDVIALGFARERLSRITTGF